MMPVNLSKVGELTSRVERHWIGGAKADLKVYRLPIEYLYFNIENGRYADRMIRLRAENPGRDIDPREDEWKDQIEKMLAGEHSDTARDKAAFEKLLDDLEARDQLRPGVVLQDGGVLDGNRRLAALRRLWKRSKNPAKYSKFEAVILPDETTDEDRWRIEAGLQLGINERWDYSPINELLKVRQGLHMYEQLIREKRLPAKDTPVKLVAKAIYGKSESDIQEMDARLRLIDEYLVFIDCADAYDRIGQVSEDFLEATRIIRASENHQLDAKFIAKLKAVLFYQIDHDLMDNWELRHIYRAIGGDPRKKGPKSALTNMPALEEFLTSFPEPRAIRDDLVARHHPERRPKPAPAAPPASTSTKPTAKPVVKTTPAPSVKKVDVEKAEAATEVFKRKMELAGKNNSVRKLANGAKADLKTLETELSSTGVRKHLSVEDRTSVAEALDAIAQSLAVCKAQLKK